MLVNKNRIISQVSKKILGTINVIILDVMTRCNHLIMKTTLFGEGRKGKTIRSAHKNENVPRILSDVCDHF